MDAVSEIPWVRDILAAGLQPYIATTESLATAFDLAPWGLELTPVFLEDARNAAFLRAYQVAERLSYGGWGAVAAAYQAGHVNYDLPDWAFVDCYLLQSAAVGLMIPTSAVPEAHLQGLAQAGVALERLDWLPLSGEVCSVRADGRSLIGVSTFDLHRRLFGRAGWARESHALSLAVRRAADYDWFVAVTQYANHAIRLHGRFGSDPVIVTPSVPVYGTPDASYIYKMKIDFDPCNLSLPPARTPDRRLRAGDAAAKRQIAAEIAQGWRHTLVPPYWSAGTDVSPAEPFLSVCVARPDP